MLYQTFPSYVLHLVLLIIEPEINTRSKDSSPALRSVKGATEKHKEQRLNCPISIIS